MIFLFHELTLATDHSFLAGAAIVSLLMFVGLIYVWWEARKLHREIKNKDGGKLLGVLKHVFLAAAVSAFLTADRLFLHAFFEAQSGVARTILSLSAQAILLGTIVWAFMRARSGFNGHP
jgi:formate hydrogenlyase subunit 3/multisubunit Na+/H+ antiporter MnhD subunit